MLQDHGRSLPFSQWEGCLELHFPEDTKARCSNCSEASVLTTFSSGDCGLAKEGGGMLFHFLAYLRNCSIHLGLRDHMGLHFPACFGSSFTPAMR